MRSKGNRSVGWLDGWRRIFRDCTFQWCRFNIVQNLERYFGFRIDLTDDLDPLRVEVLMERANQIMALYDYDEEQFHVYLHRVNISKVKASVSGFSGGLAARLDRLEISFAVNPKQKRSRKIRLFNYLIDEPLDGRVIINKTAHVVAYELPGVYLTEERGFRNEIITFVAKDLRGEHRKIKVTVTPVPSCGYQNHLRYDGAASTKIDFRFRKPIVLGRPSKRLPSSETARLSANDDPLEGNTMSVDRTINIYGNVNSIGDGVHFNLADPEDVRLLLKDIKRVAELGAREGDLNESETKDLDLAGQSLENGDQKGTLNYIMNGGRKVLGVAEKIGANVLSALIKSQMGIG